MSFSLPSRIFDLPASSTIFDSRSPKMGVFPDRLVTSMYTRQHAARKVMREQNLFKPTPNDVVRVLGLTKENQGEKAAAFCQSLWKLPYEEQLKFKQERLMKQMKRLSEIVQQDILLPVIDEETNLFRGLTIYPMIPSPKTTGYRGKDGYMISYGIDGDPATVGMPYGSQKLLVTVPPATFHTIAKPVHVTMAQLFQDYLRSPDTPSDAIANSYFEGYGYKFVTVRSNRQSDKIMLIAQFLTCGVKPHIVVDEAKRLADHFLGRTFPELPTTSRIASLYFERVHKRYCRPEEAIFQHLGGDTFIEETLLGRTFRISPQSFFQINVECAELLFRTVIEQCQLDKDTVLLDLGCGAGVYSIVLADHVKRAIGIDVNPACIADAELNASLNGVTNSKFIRGRLETIPEEDLEDMTRSDEKLVAVVNPGRWGLMAETVMALRQFSTLRTLIYVSCYPYESAFANFVNLMRQPNEEYVGEPFRLIKAIPVDMFPQTPHYEVVLLFQR